MNNLAIIPARGGSKRIPRKNLKDFLGKPIITYSIEAALISGLFDEVVVSTDDSEIAEMAVNSGASVPFFRSEKNSDDYATTSEVLVEVLEKLEKKYEICCCIYPTAPFVSAESLKRGRDLLISKNFTSVFPIVKYAYPIYRSLHLDSDGGVDLNWPEHANTRSQDLQSAFHDAGQFYWFRSDYILKGISLINSNSGGILVSEMEAHDLDTWEDWKIAESKMQIGKKKQKN